MAFKWGLGSTLPEIGAHSDAKLNLLEKYLERYFDTVAVQPAIDKLSITLVDGFSGGGTYSQSGQERVGSPFVLLRSVELAAERLNRERIKPIQIDAHFHFVEARRGTAESLHRKLVENGYGPAIEEGRLHLTNDSFENACPKILEDIKSRQRAGRSIFILDQKGWSAVQFDTMQSILKELPRSEIILTIAVDWLQTYINRDKSFSAPMSRIGISPERLEQYFDARGAAGYQYVIPRMLLNDIRARLENGAAWLPAGE